MPNRRGGTLLLRILLLVGFGLTPLAQDRLAPPVAAAAERTAGAAQFSMGVWSPMSIVAGQGAEATSAPAVVSWAAGRLDLFVRGRNGELYQNFQEQGRWFGWRVPPPFLGVMLRSAPSCASWGVGRISCVALIESDRAVWHFFYDGTRWALESLGGEARSAPVVVSPRPNQLAIFVVGTGGRLYGRAWVPGRWSGWRDLGGELRSAPACTVWRNEQVINCFVVNTLGTLSRQEIVIRDEILTGRGYVTISTNDENGSLLTLTSTPAALATGSGRISLFVLNRGQTLVQATWSGQDLLVWQRVNENVTLTTTPSCALIAPGRADCFARGSDNPMWNAFGDIVQATGALR